MPSKTSSACEPFLDHSNPDAARRALASIWAAIERLQEFPDLGMTTEDHDIRQIVVRFGSSGYIVRYATLPADGNILITRIWHGRELLRLTRKRNPVATSATK